MEPSRDILRLIEIMAALRQPDTGCPWDVKQTFETIKPYTIEEAYEVADAIERGDVDDLRDELGDLLLQVVFHARIAEEMGSFDFGDVVQAITRKMIRRHPHVFADAVAGTTGAVKLQWEEIKAAEKAERAERRARRGLDAEARPSLLDDVSRAQPSLQEALKLQQKAARVGFDWSEARPILDKVEEEIGELRTALDAGSTGAVVDEIGDLIFALVNLGRHAEVDPEMAVRGTNAKFRHRFGHIEQTLAAKGVDLAEAGLERMEAIWQDAKAIERSLNSDRREAVNRR
jgi:ATP diphosphatase